MYESSCGVTHLWKETGRVDISLKHDKWTWFKCDKCGRDGFKRGESEVAYTWRPSDMEFL